MAALPPEPAVDVTLVSRAACDPKRTSHILKINMADTQKIPWKRIAVEASAIVASILLAFAIDAWWSARQLHLDEQHILRQLEAEFEANTTLLAERRRNPRHNAG